MGSADAAATSRTNPAGIVHRTPLVHVASVVAGWAAACPPGSSSVIAPLPSSAMAILATYSPSEHTAPVELAAPNEQHSVWTDDRGCLWVGFPASSDRVPWQMLTSREQARLAAGAIEGSISPTGSWTLLANDGGGLVVRTDAHGTRPLFWRTAGECVEFADDIWSLLDPVPQLDPVGVADFLLIGHHLGRRTIFAGVSATTADSALRFGRNGITRRSFEPIQPKPFESSLDDAADMLGSALECVYEPYRDIERLLVELSGGLDSRVLIALAVEQGFHTHAWTVTLQRRSEEERLARAVAECLGVGHTVSHKPRQDLLGSARDFINRTSGQLSLEHIHAHGCHFDTPSEFNVSVNGIDGDVICGGSFLLSPGTADDQVVEARLRQLVGSEPSQLQVRLPGVADWLGRARRLVSEWYGYVGMNPRLSDYTVIRNRPGRFSVYGPISQRERLDYLPPFLDGDLWHVCYGMEERWQRQSQAYRRFVERRWPQLAAIPWEKTGLPVGKYPGRLAQRRRSLRRRLNLGAPISFTSPAIYGRALHPLVVTAVAACDPVMRELGIDVAGLLSDHPANTGTGRGLRLRLASLHLALQHSGAMPAATDTNHASRVRAAGAR